MARVWYLSKEGLEKRYMVEISLESCINVVGLKKDDYICSLKSVLKLKDVQKKAGEKRRKYVIVELTEKETRNTDFKPGYYLTKYKPEGF